MKLTRPRLIAALTVAAVSCTLLAGCSSGNSTGNSHETIHALGFGKMPASILAAFKKKTGITVQWDYVNTTTFPQVLQSRVSAKADLDILNVRGGAEFNQYAEAKTFVPLSGDPALTNVTAGGLAPGKVKGTQYGFSASSYVIGMFYNKNLFSKYNVKVPKTWPQFLAACNSLKAAGIAPISASEADGWTNQYYYHSAIAINAKRNPNFMAGLHTGKTDWSDNPLFVSQIDRFQTLVKQGDFISGAQSFHYADAVAAFNSGKAAMWAMGDWALSDLKPSGFKPGAFALPINGSGTASPASSLSDNMFGITTWSKKQKEAKEFLAFLTEKKTAKTYSVALQKASSIKGVTATISPYQADWDALLPQAVPFPSDLGPSVNGTGPNLLGDIMAGKADPKATVSGFQKLQDSDNKTGY